uniref:C-type lectin domain-containing protein n=1 Tax=Steinernema glaseri TaxID=37863 RepID=A0A1I7Y7H6_9BILA
MLNSKWFPTIFSAGTKWTVTCSTSSTARSLGTRSHRPQDYQIVPDNFFRWKNVDCDLRHYFICKKSRH